MRNKKIILILIVILLSLAGLTYYIYTKGDKETTLNLLEKQWIEKNKNNIIDMGIVSNVPVFTEGGSGLFFDFLNSLEEQTDLSFNYVPNTYENESNSDYSFSIVSELDKNDIVVYEDNYVLISRDNKVYLDPSDLSGTIGVINSDLDLTNKYLNADVTYKTFENYSELFEKFATVTEEDENNLDMIAVPKVLFMENISSSYFISYNITEMNKYYVIKLGDKDRLNDILTKYYKKWSTDNFENIWNNYFNDAYFKYTLVNEKEVVNFRSKSYKYGYVDYLPLEVNINGTLYGMSIDLLKQFASQVNIDMNFVKYKTIEDLNEAYENGKIDLMLNYDNVSDDVTVSSLKREYVVASSKNDLIINSINSLTSANVLKNSYIEKILSDKDINTKAFNTLEDLVKSSKNSVVVIDRNSYLIYSKDELKDFKIDYSFTLEDYNYKKIDNNANQVFNSFLDFYLSFNNHTALFNNSKNLISINYGKIDVKFEIYLSVIIFMALAVLGFIILKPKKKKVKAISKEDKLRYIDMLTSLKNRNYLNDNLEKWDSSEVYPQSILVIDLNNVAYINDNYGHAEGDNLIREAANILITTQESNSDIIRTSGNEFLVYMVGHDEKSVIAYKKKLSKEFKNISHGFGAAIGYSMILDGIKTIDDAINEATLDMRNNKENQEY